MITTCCSGSFLLCSFSIAVFSIRDPSQVLFCLMLQLLFIFGVQVRDLFQVLGLILTISIFKSILLEGILFLFTPYFQSLFIPTPFLYPRVHGFQEEALYFIMVLPQQHLQKLRSSQHLHSIYFIQMAQ